jgi:putative transposase
MARAPGGTTSSSSGFWRTVKYEEVYLRAYDSVAEARQSIGRYLNFYNAKRPHTALDRRTPDQVYFDPLPLRTVA